MKTLSPDVLLLHAPASFEFRNVKDIYYPYMSTSGDVPITPLYEFFPLGFKTLKSYLEKVGHSVEIVNLASVLLKYPQIDISLFISRMVPRIFGIDLHWLVHVQGALEIASIIKSIHREIPIVFGGISSTYYADQLIGYDQIDFVMCGYDTHLPMAALLYELKGEQRFAHVPNLVWKDSKHGPQFNTFDYNPATFSCGIDWSKQPITKKTPPKYPILEILSIQSAGCKFNCMWCGGSRDAFKRIGSSRTISYKTKDEIAFEFNSMQDLNQHEKYHLYLCGTYNAHKSRLKYLIDIIGETRLKSINYEQFYLTPEDVMRRMVKSNPRTCITLSPESHDQRISKLAGRGVYSMEEMEDWIKRALDIGIYGVDVWFFIGMQEQTTKSVFKTVDYCCNLLKKFHGKNVTPLLCPMIPFLDPGSTFFEFPEKYGYTTFYRTVEDHRKGMMNASLINRINYETQWLSREELVLVGYEAVKRLMEKKGELGFVPRGIASSVVSKIDDAVEFIQCVHEIDCIKDNKVRAKRLDEIGDEILKRNNEIFFSGVSNQAFPINRDIGGRWFDEIPYAILDDE